MSAPIVFYHANCWDGFCAAWALREWRRDAKFVPLHYGSTPPTPTGRDVYVLDFSFPRQTLLDWLGGSGGVKSLTLIDHHKTAEEDLRGLADQCAQLGVTVPVVVFDIEKSGGRLTWEYFNASEYLNGIVDVPGLVAYTEDRDLWRHALPDSEAVNACLRSFPLDFTLWDEWGPLRTKALRDEMAPQGEAIRRREKQIVAEHVVNAREIRLESRVGMAVNATVMFSEIAGELAKGAEFGACYFDSGDGFRQWSLRSSPSGIDVSAIAKRRGGGGHKHAAGFREMLPSAQKPEVTP